MSLDRLFSVFRISGSGLTAQRQMIEITASNIANIETTETAEGGTYIPKRVQFQEIGLRDTFGKLMETELGQTDPATGQLVDSNASIRNNRQLALEGLVRATEVNQELNPTKQIYDPENPDADENGFVNKPNINLVKEMSNMMMASRAYEANVTVMDAAKTMMKKALEI